jgi:hypothetical protein
MERNRPSPAERKSICQTPLLQVPCDRDAGKDQVLASRDRWSAAPGLYVHEGSSIGAVW